MTREEAIQVLNMVEAYGLADEAKRMAIESLQTDIVRCEDCRWQEECSQFVILHRFCGVYQGISFCSHGERREPCD